MGPGSTTAPRILNAFTSRARHAGHARLQLACIVPPPARVAALYCKSHPTNERNRPMLANIPSTQTVIQIKAPGGPEMLVPATRPVPEPKAGEVLIRIAAAGVNRADCLQRMGRYPMPPGASDIPGLECSGTVVKAGNGVSAWRPGDQVCALMIGDGYGEYAAVPEVQCLPVPKDVSLTDAGGLPETFCTVWTNVFERMRLQAGEVFLVQGGSSGIGVTAIQLAKAFGAQVLATAGSDEKCRACRAFFVGHGGVSTGAQC